MRKLTALIGTAVAAATLTVTGSGAAHADRYSVDSMTSWDQLSKCDRAEMLVSQSKTVNVAKPLRIGKPRAGFQLVQPVRLAVAVVGKTVCVKVLNSKADTMQYDYDIEVFVGSVHGKTGVGFYDQISESQFGQWTEYKMARADVYQVQAKVSATDVDTKNKVMKVISPVVELS